MSDILVILNNSNRIVDYNRSLRQLLTDCGGDCRGRLLSEVFKDYSQVVQLVSEGSEGSVEVHLKDGTDRVFRSLFAPCAAGAVVPPRSISS